MLDPTWRQAAAEAYRFVEGRGDLDERTALAIVAHFVRIQHGYSRPQVREDVERPTLDETGVLVTA